MPNIKSAKKRVLTSEKKNEINTAKKSRVKTAIKKYNAAIEAGDIALAEKLLPETWTPKIYSWLYLMPNEWSPLPKRKSI